MEVDKRLSAFEYRLTGVLGALEKRGAQNNIAVWVPRANLNPILVSHYDVSDV